MATARLTHAAPLRRPDRQPQRTHLRVVRHGERRRAVGLNPFTGVVLTVLVFAGLFAVAVSHALLIGSQASIDDLEEQVAAEQARYERNRLEVAELESPDRIVAEARNRLGMVSPAETVWITPDRPVPAADDRPAEPATPDTSWKAEVKPYLEPTTP